MSEYFRYGVAQTGPIGPPKTTKGVRHTLESGIPGSGCFWFAKLPPATVRELTGAESQKQLVVNEEAEI